MKWFAHNSLNAQPESRPDLCHQPLAAELRQPLPQWCHAYRIIRGARAERC